jgi:hypothetical protein
MKLLFNEKVAVTSFSKEAPNLLKTLALCKRLQGRIRQAFMFPEEYLAPKT